MVTAWVKDRNQVEEKGFTEYIPHLISDFTVFGLNKIPEAKQ